MSWTDESGNPECECSHLWSNHYHALGMYFCEAPECECLSFSELNVADRVANSIFELEESDKIALDYDCEQHGKGQGSDCPVCFDSEPKIKGRYVL